MWCDFVCRDMRFIQYFFLSLICLSGSQSTEAGLPVLVRHQPAIIQQAWRDIEQVLQENQQLNSPLAEPYLARGDLWSRMGSHEDALADYLKATEIFFQGNPTPGEQARHLARLRSSLEAVVIQPKPRFPADAIAEFDRGLSAFRSGEFSTANSFFIDCTRLMPDEPLYRVYRALTHRQLDQHPDAKRQVEIAVSLVRAKGIDAVDQLALINRGLEPVQGPLRYWLTTEFDQVAKLPPGVRLSMSR